MPQRILIITVLFCSISVNGYGGELVDREGGFAYNVPAGWELIENPAGRYTAMSRFKMAVDPKNNARIAVTVGFDWALLTFADQRKIVLQSLYRELTPAEFKNARQSIIETAVKQRAVRFSFARKTKDGTIVHQWIYLFSRQDKIIVEVDCVAPADAAHDRIIASAMNSFRIIR